MKERLFVNGKIITMDENLGTSTTKSGRETQPDSVLVRGNRIEAVGTKEELNTKVSTNAEIVDLDGKTMLPGFNDNHLHLVGLGSTLAVPDLFGLSKQEIIQALRERYENNDSSDWVQGRNWDYPTCPNPHRRDLDTVFPDRPAILSQFSGHGAWCNSAALKKLKIGQNTKVWPNGQILRDKDGYPNGILREPYGNPAMRWRAIKTMWSRKEIRKAIETATVKLREAGITSVQDNTWFPPVLSEIKRLHRQGRLTARVSCWSLGEVPLFFALLNMRSYNPQWFKKGPVKFFWDGAFSSRTAWLMENYTDEPENGGKGRTAEEMVKRMEPHVRRHRQIAAHSIGDRSSKEYCDVVEMLRDKYPWVTDLRIRIEHSQLFREEDFERIASLGMLACAQPSALIDAEKDITLLGAERAQHAYPYRSLLDSGVHLSFGSDFPGEYSYEPLVGIQNASTREGAERITVEEAIRCYTANSAYAEGVESDKGTITPGKLADFVVLEENPLEIDPSKIAEIAVSMTVVDGRTVYGSQEKSSTEEPITVESGSAKK